FQAVRAGGRVGRVGVPHDVDYNEWIDSLFWKNIQLGGGVASVARWDKEILLEAVLSGEINPFIVINIMRNSHTTYSPSCSYRLK
ncbi:hypothetical protein ACI3SI_19690, partial [Lactococcus lactis]